MNKNLGILYYFAIYMKGCNDNTWDCILHVSQAFFTIYCSGGFDVEFDICSRFAKRANLFEKRYGVTRIFLNNEDVTTKLYNSVLLR